MFKENFGKEFNVLNLSEQEDYSDDDDVSWKIRRAASKCLEAIISTRHEFLGYFYTEVSPILIGRFKGKYKNLLYRFTTI